jgi:hypothetical protein
MRTTPGSVITVQGLGDASATCLVDVTMGSPGYGRLVVEAAPGQFVYVLNLNLCVPHFLVPATFVTVW